MFRNLLFIVLLALPFGCFASIHVRVMGGANVRMAQPETITLAGDALLLKYDGWYFYQDNLDPTRVYSSVDLSGVLGEFFKTVFDPSKCKLLPAQWLCTLAEGQAESLHIEGSSLKHWHSADVTFYAFYESETGAGNVFIIYKESVQRIKVKGSEAAFNSLIKKLSGGVHAAN